MKFVQKLFNDNHTGNVLPVVVVIIVAFTIYFNALYNDFVYDDKLQVLQNKWIRDVRSLPDIFSTSVWSFNSERASSNYFRPLMQVIYMINFHIFGLKAWGFHLVNILFHAANSVLVFLIASMLPGEENKQYAVSNLLPTFLSSPPFIAAILFATHPIHTEAVTWIAGLPDLAFAFFYLFSFKLYMRYRKGITSGYLLSLVLFFLSTLCKEPAVTLPLIIIAYDYAFRETEINFSIFLKYLPYIFIVGVYGVLRLNALKSLTPIEMSSYKGINAYHYIINVFPLFLEYLKDLFYPFDLNFGTHFAQ